MDECSAILKDDVNSENIFQSLVVFHKQYSSSSIY